MLAGLPLVLGGWLAEVDEDGFGAPALGSEKAERDGAVDATAKQDRRGTPCHARHLAPAVTGKVDSADALATARPVRGLGTGDWK